MGAVAVPVSTMYNGTELGELLRDTRARVVVATGEFAAVTQKAMSLAPEATALVLIGEPGQPGQPGQAGQPGQTGGSGPPGQAVPAGEAGRRAEARPSLFFAGPASLAALLAADVPPQAFASVGLATSAGEALPAEIYRRFTSRYGVDIIDGLGSTEALHIFISNQPGAVRPGTSGTVVPGYEARLVDDNGEPVADGHPGRLRVRGDSIATGYWCRTATTRQVFAGEWLRTGDTYIRSGDGFYTCLGRTNDMIKAGGIWVSPTEVEARIVQHESVAECAVVGLRDADGLEEVVACVVAMPGRAVDGGELIAFCREGLAAFKRPRQVLVLGGLPKTATRKIQRVVVRANAADALRK